LLKNAETKGKQAGHEVESEDAIDEGEEDGFCSDEDLAKEDQISESNQEEGE